MVRVLLYLALVAVFAFGAIWIVDRPGALVIDWQGYKIETSVAVAAAFVAVVAGCAVVLWNVMRWILAGPEAFALFRRNRRRSKGYDAIARGVVAVGTGDARRAGKEASEARRLLGKEPLTLVLAAQAAQLSGDRSGAEAAFRAMTETPATRSLGLRGLFIEAERRGDRAAAKALAEDAARQSPETPWAGQALFDFQCAEHDWSGALSTLERLSANRLLDKADARRRRAVLLTALATDGAAADAPLAIKRAREAHSLAADFAPAAILAARLLAEQGDARKAAKIVETTWAKAPHPDLAEVYVHVRPGDPARDKLKRARTLSERSGDDPEGLFAVARAGLAARDFDVARSAIDRLLGIRPTVRACMLMAELEEVQNGDAGRSREWLARALRAPRDPVWVADGVASDTWAPTSPVTGKLDAFVWKMPVEETRPKLAADAWLDQAPVEQRSVLAALEPTDAALPRRMPTLIDGEAQTPVAAAPVATTPAKPAAVVEAAAEPVSTKAAPARPTAAVFPLSRAPDDPGPNAMEAADTMPGERAFPARPNY
ncbi:heme biosynthesis protein HemY [Hansschlegelia plantiphila]|uniref:Heme biosynthesis protein HemY n=1 Tax=Hansschlegelia plantiphila TaxID=374655 RepID=A0A9W6IXE7_9HYPH|nr:heme biosynthesis HemY N-terminal domain-containing protein [Hansschlegelia plantiphila]GLK66472.1 heme biosynthesis protein HemY [Hansschlegelia plantiphila]